MPKVMLIEDDPTMQSLLGTLLDMEGYHVVIPEMESLEGIFQTLQKEKPDLALLDVNLRDGTGFDLLQRINLDGELKKTRILMSSGSDYRDECSKAGADGFLLKPYMPNDLIQLIHKILETNGELGAEK
jgi:DNA-binding response OmpR family regulator